MSNRFFSAPQLLAGSALLALTACDEPMDFDLRGAFGEAPSTADAARNASAERPRPDDRGIISYPGYQVAVARRGDTLQSLADRIGADAGALAKFNGMQPSDGLRKGEIIALPSRVAEPEGGPIQPPSQVDITALADGAIAEADASQAASPAPVTSSQIGAQPVRHKVERGESAYTIARLYDVSIRSLAEWNGLGADFAVREGQFLLIPVARNGQNPDPFDPSEGGQTAAPGQGSPTPTPPSASKPLPAETTKPAAEPVETVAAPDLSASQTATSTSARMSYPVKGDIIREYSKGKNDGIDISASPGTPVRAAADGVVAAITKDTNGIPIIVVKHSDNLLTVYSNVGNVSVSKGDTINRGGKLAEIRREGSAALHFEVREGFDSVDPLPYLR